ncbi:DNA helicase Rep [Simiduia agarivorans]|uniref:ATP-dependent DNA helicase Rep n=1 Tax=Simiduia agarivorans (strain DSM 21679 / JCM 13881 / BCRC 17597 / SA1) TaxID=1117647 RepID=K4KNG9_SIMAS|nr:DNA helicase Rep [Simiduia agarivorans]AFU99770.1 ATP-dependent DNA helicase Rep [Simiduia agarivorans SA1 = DSM 21679]
MSAHLAKLNPRQKEAVLHIDGPCLVLAGAGSGKTSVITRKIAYLIEECGMPARHIAAVTFTNKASREMKERVGGLVKGSAARGLTVSTFHNLGLNIIRREHKALGMKASFSIFDAEDARALLKELMLKDGDLDSDHLDLVANQISNWKNDLVIPAMAASKAASPGEAQIAEIYRRYNQALRAYNAVDFDDLILTPVRLFSEQPEVLEKWRRKIRYLLVDEYQDTNSSQYLLVKLIVGDRGGLTVVGDDDQSIYAWRGARPENLSLLKKDFPSLSLIKLEQNYRSTSRILRVANHLIAHNPHEFDKALWSEMGLGEPIRVIRCANEDAESERVAMEILSQRLKRQAKFSDFAILYRGNHQARLLEIKLQAHQIPYTISGGTSFFARAEIKDVMSYLRLIVNPDDDNAFLRIINTPRRQIGPSTLEAIGHYANERHISMFNACGEIGLGEHMPEASLERIRRFHHWVLQMGENCRGDDPVGALKQLVEDIDYEGWLHQNASAPKVAERRMENVWYLLDSIKAILQKADDDELTVEDAIAKLMLRDMLERQEEEDLGDQVQLMTLHASKGLEYPHVFMVGMEEDLLPHRTSIEEDNIEEERRLTYVGITRAQKTLTMTWAAKRKQYGEIIETSYSRFLDELPEEDVVSEGLGQHNPEVNRAQGSAMLGSLLDMLKK